MRAWIDSFLSYIFIYRYLYLSVWTSDGIYAICRRQAHKIHAHSLCPSGGHVVVSKQSTLHRIYAAMNTGTGIHEAVWYAKYINMWAHSILVVSPLYCMLIMLSEMTNSQWWRAGKMARILWYNWVRIGSGSEAFDAISAVLYSLVGFGDGTNHWGAWEHALQGHFEQIQVMFALLAIDDDDRVENAINVIFIWFSLNLKILLVVIIHIHIHHTLFNDGIHHNETIQPNAIRNCPPDNRNSHIKTHTLIHDWTEHSKLWAFNHSLLDWKLVYRSDDKWENYSFPFIIFLFFFLFFVLLSPFISLFPCTNIEINIAANHMSIPLEFAFESILQYSIELQNPAEWASEQVCWIDLSVHVCIHTEIGNEFHSKPKMLGSSLSIRMTNTHRLFNIRSKWLRESWDR